MYKIFGAIIVMFTILLQTFAQTVLFGDYLLNTRKYAAYCNIEAMPDNYHAGQCHLDKKLEDMDPSDKKDHKKSEQVRENQVVFYVPERILTLNSAMNWATQTRNFPPILEKTVIKRAYSILKPPRLTA